MPIFCSISKWRHGGHICFLPPPHDNNKIVQLCKIGYELPLVVVVVVVLVVVVLVVVVLLLLVVVVVVGRGHQRITRLF